MLIIYLLTSSFILDDVLIAVVVVFRRRVVLFSSLPLPAPGATIMEGFLYTASYTGLYTLGHDVSFAPFCL